MSAIIMNNSRFDVVAYIRKLRNAGVTQEIAEVQGKELEHVIGNILKQTRQDNREFFDGKETATKSDVRGSELQLQKDISLVHGEIRETELRLQKEITDLRYATLKFVVWTSCTASVVVIGAVFTMLKFMLYQS